MRTSSGSLQNQHTIPPQNPTSALHHLPQELKDDIVGFIEAGGDKALAAETLASLMRASKSMNYTVNANPVLRAYIAPRLNVARAMSAKGFITPDKKVQASLAHCRHTHDADDLENLLDHGNLSALSAGERDWVIAQVRGNSDAEMRLPLLFSLSENLHQLEPRQQRELVKTLLEDEPQHVLNAANNLAQLTPEERSAEEGKVFQQYQQLRGALGQLIPHFAELSPQERKQVFEAFPDLFAFDSPNTIDKDVVQNLARSASHLTPPQLETLQSWGNASPEHQVALSAGAAHLPAEMLHQLVTSLVGTTRAPVAPKEKTISCFAAMGAGISRLTAPQLRRLIALQPTLASRQQAELSGALAPVYKHLPDFVQQDLLKPIRQCGDAAIKNQAMKSLNQNFLNFPANRQQEILAMNSDSAHLWSATNSPLQALATQFSRLDSLHQQPLLALLSPASTQLSSDKKSHLLEGMLQSFHDMSPHEMARQPWRALVESARDLAVPDYQEMALGKLSMILDDMLQRSHQR